MLTMRMVVRSRSERQMGRHQRHPQLTAEQQHDRHCRTGPRSEIFGVAGECVAGIHQDALLYGCGHHGREFTVHAAVAGAVQHLDHVRRVARVWLTCGHRLSGRNVHDFEYARAMQG
jgi:hypothetical protein